MPLSATWTRVTWHCQGIVTLGGESEIFGGDYVASTAVSGGHCQVVGGWPLRNILERKVTLSRSTAGDSGCSDVSKHSEFPSAELACWGDRGEFGQLKGLSVLGLKRS